ncbi:hypothetical protein THAOC_32773 [Thalassiosira oceanica]|uniref:Uncharacterized protein n=1 Tax=Thalassiosira oceanica TaxID=159749 RepID=K0R588_THAOC|nr:hypothetical protein THAOC_32773 [Thalassiosira oceanica]|eukprot:EJK48428.1 hypothetical protein THAOC_32773 [Thalassiosira oceanica]
MLNFTSAAPSGIEVMAYGWDPSRGGSRNLVHPYVRISERGVQIVLRRAQRAGCRDTSYTCKDCASGISPCFLSSCKFKMGSARSRYQTAMCRGRCNKSAFSCLLSPGLTETETRAKVLWDFISEMGTPLNSRNEDLFMEEKVLVLANGGQIPERALQRFQLAITMPEDIECKAGEKAYCSLSN